MPQLELAVRSTLLRSTSSTRPWHRIKLATTSSPQSTRMLLATLPAVEQRASTSRQSTSKKEALDRWVLVATHLPMVLESVPSTVIRPRDQVQCRAVQVTSVRLTVPRLASRVHATPMLSIQAVVVAVAVERSLRSQLTHPPTLHQPSLQVLFLTVVAVSTLQATSFITVAQSPSGARSTSLQAWEAPPRSTLRAKLTQSSHLNTLPNRAL